jgi:hypothetical protein
VSVQTPSLSVYLTGEAARDREAAKNVQCSLEYTTLRRVTEATEIFYDPIPEVRAPPRRAARSGAVCSCVCPADRGGPAGSSRRPEHSLRFIQAPQRF